MKVILFANTEWYLFNFRLPLAKALRARGFEVLLISPPGDYGQRLQDAGFRWQPLPMDRRSLHPWHELRLLAHLVRLYRREQPAVVHHFTIKCVIYGGLAAALARVPARVNAVTGLGYVFLNPAPKARLLRPLVRWLMQCVVNNAGSRLILQNSEDLAAFQQAKLADTHHIRLIKGSGVDSRRFQPAVKPAPARGETRVLLAARQLRAAGLPIRFLLAGAPDPGNPASIPAEQLTAWAGRGRGRSAGSRGRYAGAVCPDGHRGVAQLSGGFAQEPDRGRRLRSPTGDHRRPRLPGSGDRRRGRAAGPGPGCERSRQRHPPAP